LLGPNLGRAGLFEANLAAAGVAAEWRGGDKDKIAGSGFNKARRLADERSGERR